MGLLVTTEHKHHSLPEYYADHAHTFRATAYSSSDVWREAGDSPHGCTADKSAITV